MNKIKQEKPRKDERKNTPGRTDGLITLVRYNKEKDWVVSPPLTAPCPFSCCGKVC